MNKPQRSFAMPYTYNPIQGRGERLHSSSPITHLHKQFITHTLQNQSREQRHRLPLWLSGFFQRMKQNEQRNDHQKTTKRGENIRKRQNIHIYEFDEDDEIKFFT